MLFVMKTLQHWSINESIWNGWRTLNKQISAVYQCKTKWTAGITISQVLFSDHVECSDNECTSFLMLFQCHVWMCSLTFSFQLFFACVRYVASSCSVFNRFLQLEIKRSCHCVLSPFCDWLVSSAIIWLHLVTNKMHQEFIHYQF